MIRTARLLWLASLLAAPVCAHEIEGTWIFQEEKNTRADGSPAPVPAAQYDGMIIYTADGHVSANIMPRGRRWTLDTVTPADLFASVGEGAVTAYAGRYAIDAAARTVTHIIAVSVDPGDTGRRLVRRFEVKGDDLYLSGTWTHAGETLTFTVHWKRA